MIVNVVLVTYNRKQCLARLLEGLQKQSVKINKVFIFNNNSSDGTTEYLISQGYLDNQEYKIEKCYPMERQYFDIVYYVNKSNIGGSGGFSKVLGIALEEICDYIWIMDDDVLPEENCLELLLANMDNKVRACIPNRSDEYYVDRPCVEFNLEKVFVKGLMPRKTFINHPLSEKKYFVKDMPFEGPLIDYDVVKKVGISDPSYFILCDDSDYAQRVLKHSNICFVTDAVLHRQLAKETMNAKKNNKNMNWRDYYAIRNSILFLNKHASNKIVSVVSPIFSFFIWCGISLIKRRWRNFPIVIKATIDGVKGVSGATIKPGEF